MKWKTRFDDPELGRITLKFGHWFPNLMGTDAVTIGRTIRCRNQSMSVGLYYHERAHIWRYIQNPGKTLADMATWFWQGVLHGFSRAKHPWELEADRKAVEYAAARVPVPLLRRRT